MTKLKATVQETVDIIARLRKYYTMEEIALLVGKRFPTISLWKAGKRTPDLGNFRLLQAILKTKEPDYGKQL